MVARTPPKLKKIAAAIDPVLLRETLKKVDRCMARLQELQYTVAGGRKVVSGVSLSPRSTRGYLKTSLRCKQESLRIKSAAPLRSPVGKFPPCSGGEWRRMSLPAMLVGETVGEILQATQFAREVLAVVSNKNKPTLDEPKTPMTQGKSHDRFRPENTELISKRKKEKRNKARESNNSPSLQRARSQINFKVSPPKVREVEKENGRYLANRVSPRNKPWAKKAVLFPNPLFLSTPTKQQQKFCKTRSPVIPKKRETQTPHKFLIKSPQKHNSSNSKFQVKIKSPPKVSLSPVRNSTKTSITASKLRRSFSPANLRRSFSPSKIANRLMSPLKGRKSLEKKSCDGLLMTGLKQRPAFTPIQFSNRRTQATGYC